MLVLVLSEAALVIVIEKAGKPITSTSTNAIPTSTRLTQN